MLLVWRRINVICVASKSGWDLKKQHILISRPVLSDRGHWEEAGIMQQLGLWLHMPQEEEVKRKAHGTKVPLVQL